MLKGINKHVADAWVFNLLKRAGMHVLAASWELLCLHDEKICRVLHAAVVLRCSQLPASNPMHGKMNL
jgi:hypothetical protein